MAQKNNRVAPVIASGNNPAAGVRIHVIAIDTRSGHPIP